MSEMIERVAKAILAEQQSNRSSFPSNLDLARAAMAAMREPTNAMCEAGSTGFAQEPSLEDNRAHYIQRQRNAWGAMIDAALR